VTLLILIGFGTAFTKMPSYPPEVTNATLTGVTSTLAPLPMLLHNWRRTTPNQGIIGGIFFGYSNALLGISGFESSSNYVEEQAPGVFPKTLRNMWIAVTLINPLTALLAQCLMPVDAIADQAESGALLSQLAEISGGSFLKVLIVIDGAMVLVGAVIVAFVGFTGLTHRMTLDRCLPQFLLQRNRCRGTRHWIICGFWFLTSVLVVFTNGNVDVMAGIYTMAFLTVMILFSVGNMLIKLKRSSLPTPMRVSYPVVILAFLMMSAGLLGNILSRDTKSLQGFVMFGACFFIPVQLMLNRVFFMRLLASIVRPCISVGNPRASCCMRYFKPILGPFIKEYFHDPLIRGSIRLQEKPLVFFTNNDDPPVLLDAIQYFKNNEVRRWIKFVRVFDNKSEMPQSIPRIYKSLGELFTDLQIDYVATSGKFGPEMVRNISFRYKVPSNFMFMSSFGQKMSYSFMELGGLRLITPNIHTIEQQEQRLLMTKQDTNGPQPSP